MAKINIDPNKPVSTISPRIYGHFTEHIGGVNMMADGVTLRNQIILAHTSLLIFVVWLMLNLILQVTSAQELCQH